jgi:hypothetical protein
MSHTAWGHDEWKSVTVPKSVSPGRLEPCGVYGENCIETDRRDAGTPHLNLGVRDDDQSCETEMAAVARTPGTTGAGYGERSYVTEWSIANPAPFSQQGVTSHGQLSRTRS